MSVYGLIMKKLGQGSIWKIDSERFEPISIAERLASP